MEQNKQNITVIEFKKALEERYLSYALSTIVARSLPDVRDGLKPVHRRLIYAMQALKLDPKSAPKKCARIVGDVSGKFHPHGEVAIYNTLVRLAQDFSLRYPLIEGQGNFGNIDGDSPAAHRYTEARLTFVAEMLMEGLGENAVDFRATYNGEFEEPVVFPSAIPNLLANGAEGIAVGMATSIPPHNMNELCRGLIHLIDQPDATLEDLMTHIKGPDFPTGGTVVDSPQAIHEIYKTGRGTFRLRAKYEIEPLGAGQYQIIVTEIPYQVQKGRLIEELANLLISKKVPLLADVHDESAETVRIVLTPKSRSVDADVLMKTLYKSSDLESRVTMNMNVLDYQNVPQVMNLKQVLEAFLVHRFEVLKRQSNHRLTEIAQRLEILKGYLIAFLNLDEVIKLIREEDDPKPVMMKKWSLSDIQAESILNMRLRSLKKLEEMQIKTEAASLEEEQKTLRALLKDEGQQRTYIKNQLTHVDQRFAADKVLGPRRTQFASVEDEDDIPVEAVIEREPVTIFLSEKGWIRSFKGHSTEAEEVKYKEGDQEYLTLKAHTTDKIVLMGSNGRFYTIPAHTIPGGRGFGEPLRLFMELDQNESILFMTKYEEGSAATLVLASSDGRGFQVALKDCIAQTKNGKQILSVPEGVKAQICVLGEGDHVAVIGDNRKLLIFPLAELPFLAKGRGVRLQKYVQGGLADLKVFAVAQGLTWQKKNKTYTETVLATWLGKRAGAGRLPPTGFPKNNRFRE